MEPATAAEPQRTLSDDERRFVTLVKALDVDGLARFLEEHADFDCDMVSFEDFLDLEPEAEEVRPYATAIFWLLNSSPRRSDEKAFLDGASEARVLQLLVTHGADLRRPYGDHGASILHIFTKNASVVKLLVTLGANVHAMDSGGNTPLHVAAYLLHLRSTHSLLAAGARVNQQNWAGETALHRVLTNLADVQPTGERLSLPACVMDALLEAGASWSCTDAEGVTPLQLLFVAHDHNTLVVRGIAMAALATALQLARSVQLHLQNVPPDYTLLLPSTKNLQVHQWLLSASSKKFRAMAGSQMREAAERITVLKDIDEPSVELIIKCVYGKPLTEWKWEGLSEIARVADQHMFEGVSQLCEERLCATLDIENACDALLLADDLHLHSLRTRSVCFIADNHDNLLYTDRFIAACRNPRFASFMPDILGAAKESRKRKRQSDAGVV